jgi:hypothetical protein
MTSSLYERGEAVSSPLASEVNGHAASSSGNDTSLPSDDAFC